MAGYLGAIPVPQATQHRESFTATSGQTTFNTAGYTVGFLDVYLNGSHLSPADFTATNGSDVVLASGASTGDVCDIISYTAFEVNSQTFTGTTTLDGAVVINESSADVDFRVESNGNANMLFVDGGNDAVGIGTSSPSTSYKNALQVHGADGGGNIRITNDTTGTGTGNGFEAVVVGVDAYLIQREAAPLIFYTSNTEAMRIDSSGNVGIGTSSPSVPIEAVGSLDILQLTGTTGNAFARFTDSDASSDFSIGADDNSGSGAGAFVIYDRNATAYRMTLDSSGNFGIGTSSPQLGSAWNKVLHIHSSGGLGSHIRFTDTTSGETGESGLFIGQYGNDAYLINRESGSMLFSNNGTERMRIDSSGNLLVGTVAEPSASQTGVRVSGTDGQNFWKSSNSGTSGYDQLAFFNGNGLVGTISTSGSATAYNTSSDYRLKTDAQPMTGASARVQALNPVNFEWIADGTRVDGFLAHEAQEVVPEAVTGTKDAMRDEEYQVSAATGDIYTPATDAYVDEDGNDVDAVDEVIHSADVEQPETLEDGQQWRETTPAVMGTRSVPDMQGIDQSKMVPLLVAALQEALARITALEG